MYSHDLERMAEIMVNARPDIFDTVGTVKMLEGWVLDLQKDDTPGGSIGTGGFVLERTEEGFSLSRHIYDSYDDGYPAFDWTTPA